MEVFLLLAAYEQVEGALKGLVDEKIKLKCGHVFVMFTLGGCQMSVV